jgi:hypothetical protein
MGVKKSHLAVFSHLTYSIESPFSYFPNSFSKLSEKGRRGLQSSLIDYPKALFVLRTPAKFTLGALLELPFRTISEERFSEVRIPDPA